MRTALRADHALESSRQGFNERGVLDISLVKGFYMQIDSAYYEAYWLLKLGLGHV